MASVAGLRPNHYETLGVSPTASEAEIARAFARLMGMFGVRPVAAAAQISIAFEVLRNPGKRLDYDREIGIAPEPEPLPWSFGGVAKSSPGLIGSAWSGFGEQVTGAPVKRPEPAPEPPRAAPPEPSVASFIASSLREPPREEAPPRRTPATSAPLVRDEEDRPIDWRRPALAVGVLILGAGLIGTMAGLSVKDAEDGAPGTTVTVPAPAKAAAQAPAVSALPVQTVAEPAVQPAARAKAAAARKLPRPSASFAEKAVEQAPSLAASAGDQPALEQASDDSAADPLAPTAAPATMPLSNATIARTIERIGYSCGSVVSTSAGGAPGTYDISCSSGHSYQAKPVHGRYRFRRSH